MEFHNIFTTTKQKTIDNQTYFAKKAFEQGFQNDLTYLNIYNKIYQHIIEKKKSIIQSSPDWIRTLNDLYDARENYSKNSEVNVFQNEFKN